MPDNVVANPGAGGAQFRAFSDGTNEWPASVVSYVTGGSAGAWTLQQVDGTHGLPVAVQGTVPVSGTFFQATQPVSIAATVNTSAVQSGTWNVTVNTALPSGGALIGGVNLVDSAGANKASVSAAGAVKVDGSAVTQPVSGTFWQATQPVSGTFWQATQPVSIAATVNTSDLADGPVTPGTVATKSTLVGAQFNTSSPTLTTGQQAALQVDSSGNLKVNVVAGGGAGSNAAAGATGSAVPADADYNGVNVGGTLRGQTAANPTGTVYAAHTDLTSVGGTSVALGQTTMTASIPVVIASNQSAVPVSVSGTATVSGTVTANVGTTNGLALDATLTGGSQLAVPVAGTSGGATPYHLVSAASTNATSVKAAAGTVYSVQGFNTNASPRYLKLYDKASAPTVGTDTPKKVIMLPGNTSGAGATADFPVGVNFTLGIAFAITGGIADTDATAIGANDCVINFDYK